MKKILITFAVLFIAISAFAQIAGSTYENPITVTLPLSGYTGDTSLYGDDYESGWVDPSFSYLGGDDMVLEFTLAETSYLSGTLASTDGGTWIGMCVVNQAPDPINAAPTFARASSSSGNTATLDATVVPAGTYALIIGTWPSPQSFQFTLDLTASAVPTEPELAVDPTVWDFGELVVGNTASKQFTLTNIGGGSLEISSVVVSGNNFSLTEAFTPISLGIQESDTFTVEYAPTVAGTHAGTITISDNRATTVINLSGTATDPTITSFPWTEGFESVTTPALPTHWSVTEGSTGASRHWATTSSDSHGASAANSGDNFAYLYCYLASTTYNPYSLITPPIALDATEKRLSYYYWIGDNTYAEPLFVDVSTDLSNWTTLYTHDTSNTLAWFNNTVSLSAYASSTVYLRFRGVSNYGSGLCDFGIDDVVVEDIPDDPIFSYTPESIDFGGHRVNDPTDYTNVMISNTGGGTLSLAAGDISLIGTDSNQFDFTTTTGFPANLTAGQSVTVPVRFAPTSVGNKNATLRINYGGDNYDVALSGNAVSEAALLESFEDSVPPPGWASIGVYNWSRSTTRSVHGDASAYRSGSTSNQYILSTPMLDIEAGSSLDFWAAGSNTTSGLEILYSTDRENWTQIGDTIVHPGSYTFVNYNYDLGSLAGNSYYLGFRTTLVSGSSYLDYVVGPDITPALPGAPILDEPGDLDIDVNEYTTFEWDAPNTGGIPIHYNLYLDTVDGSTLFTSEVMSPYTPANPLAYETTYYWTVEAVNDAGTGPQAAVQSFTTRANPIVSTFPWTEDFGTTSSDTFPPLNWTRASGIFPIIDGTSSQWFSDDWLNGPSGNNAAKINIYGTGRKGWLITPPVDIPAGVHELKFDLALMDYGNSNQIEFPEGQADDRFIVAMATNPGMTDAVTLGEWNNTGSDRVFNDIPHTGTSVTFALEGVTGIRFFAFYGESTVSATGEDNDLMVDNVTIREVPVGPPDPVTLLSPEDGATGLAIEGFDLNWAAALTGGNPVDYAVFMSQNEANLYGDHYWDGITDTRFDPTQAALDPITYNYGETWYWTVMALNGDGDAIQETPFSFTIMDDPRILSLPYSQNFDGVPSDSMPVAWTGYVDATSTYAYVRTSTSYSVSAPNSMYLTNSNDAAADLRLITPDILVPMNSIKLSFSARGSSGYTLLIGTVDALDGTGTFSQMASIDLTSTHTIYTVSFADYVGTDQNICFKHGLGGTYRSIYIDDVQMDQLVANDLAVTAFSGDSMGIAGDELSYNVSVYNNGTAEQNAYAIQLLSMPTGQLLASLNVADPVPLAAGDTAEHVINWTPTSAGVYEVYAKVVLAGDVNDYNDASDILTVGVYAATSYIPFIGDAESSSTTNYMPFNVWYKNSVAETIYMAHEMQMASGTINAIIYYNTFTQDVNIPVKIWMAHSTETVNSAWLPFENYSLVFDGTVLFPQGVNAVVIPLQTSFEYTGGNLAVRTNRVMDTQYYSSSDKFYYTSDSSYPNRSRYYYNDTTVMDPTDPILTNNGTQSSYIPNTAFIADPYTAMPPLTAPIVQIELSGTNPQLSWEAVAGAYEYVIYGSDDPHNWAEATEIGTTTDLDYTVYSAPAMKFYKVAARSYNHQIREIGQVFNPAAVIGFDNSSLKNMPKTIGTENKD